MQEQHLKQVHLSRLSPVMWSWQQGYPRKELGVPIKSAYGMGSTEGSNYEFATPVNPKGSPIWSETWQQRGAGALKKVHPFAMDGCGCGNEPQSNGAATNGQEASFPWVALGFPLTLLAIWFWTKREEGRGW